VTSAEEIQRRLRDTDVCFNAQDRYGLRLRGDGLDGSLDFGSPHGEEGLVGVREGLHTIFGVESELRAGLAEFGTQLGRGEDGDVEDLAGAQDLLGCGEDLGEFVDRVAEFLLKVADAAAM
jgi:hypothetical protein